MAQSAPEYLRDALAIAAGTQHAAPEEFARLQALARLMAEIRDALIWLEDAASSMPEHLYDQAGVNGAILHAREVIHQADGLTRTDEEQENLNRDREREISSEFAGEPVSLQEEIDRS